MKTERAEKLLRAGGSLSNVERKAIADELGRLRSINMATDANLAETERQLDACQRELRKARAELAALKGEAERTVYVGAVDANHALNIRLCWQDDEDDARLDTTMQASEGYVLHAVRLSARKVSP